MKYIITWVLVETANVNHAGFGVLQNKTFKTPIRIEYSERAAAFELYNAKVEEYKSQFITVKYSNSSGSTAIILCPKCWNYIDEVKIDSTK